MLTKPCIGVVLGTRPEALKLAPIVHRLREAGWSRVEVLASGQQGALVRQALASCRIYGIQIPRIAALDSDRQVDALGDALRPSMARTHPDGIVVHGDTATALAGARVAVQLGIPVFHVEAGLRTHDLRQPYPEEAHRCAIAKLAALHFAPTPIASANLLDEGVPAENVFVTGNTIVDVLMRGDRRRRTRVRVPPIGVVTLHRRELRPHLDSVITGIERVLQDHAGLTLIIPAHPNPHISDPLVRTFRTQARAHIVPPLPHGRFLALLARASVVITDSGGVQEEAALLGVPLVIARNLTERPEVLFGGRAIVAGYDGERIREAVDAALKWAPSLCSTQMLGDGQAALRIEQHLFRFFSAQDVDLKGQACASCSSAAPARWDGNSNAA